MSACASAVTEAVSSDPIVVNEHGVNHHEEDNGALCLPLLESLPADFNVCDDDSEDDEDKDTLLKKYLSNPKKCQTLRDFYICLEKLREYATCWVAYNPGRAVQEKDKDVSSFIELFYNEMKSREEELCRTGESRPWFFYIAGSLLNISEQFDRRAEQSLTRAIKLAPKSARSWTELGECLYKKDADSKYAKTCFENALKQDETYAPALCGLSITIRRLSQNAKDSSIQKQELDKSLGFAKRAVDACPWSRCFFVLGNAHVSRFFRATLSPDDLLQAEAAYAQATQGPGWRQGVKYSADYFYNRGVVASYRERPSDAIRDYRRAADLDPDFQFARSMADKLYSSTKRVGSLVQSRAGLKKKRLESILTRLKPERDLSGLPKLLQLTPLHQLKEGKNPGAVALGKVIATDNSMDCLPFFLILVDGPAGSCVSVSLYNVNPELLAVFQIGDSLAIREPYVTTVRLEVLEEDPSKGSLSVRTRQFKSGNSSSISCAPDPTILEFRQIRVDRPFDILINGSRTPRDFLNPLQLTTSNRASQNDSSPSSTTSSSAVQSGS